MPWAHVRIQRSPLREWSGGCVNDVVALVPLLSYNEDKTSNFHRQITALPVATAAPTVVVEALNSGTAPDHGVGFAVRTA
jgi:hypothetical protein